MIAGNATANCCNSVVICCGNWANSLYKFIIALPINNLFGFIFAFGEFCVFLSAYQCLFLSMESPLYCMMMRLNLR